MDCITMIRRTRTEDHLTKQAAPNGSNSTWHIAQPYRDCRMPTSPLRPKRPTKSRRLSGDQHDLRVRGPKRAQCCGSAADLLDRTTDVAMALLFKQDVIVMRRLTPKLHLKLRAPAASWTRTTNHLASRSSYVNLLWRCCYEPLKSCEIPIVMVTGIAS